MPLFCRYYSQKYPEMDDVVMVTVRSIAEMGAYVHLLEYNNIEGMILLSELSRRRIRSMNKLIRVGKTEPVVVIRVDKEKGKVKCIIMFKWCHCSVVVYNINKEIPCIAFSTLFGLLGDIIVFMMMTVYLSSFEIPLFCRFISVLHFKIKKDES